MKPSVLIVDDSLTVRMDLKEAFEAAGFDVTPCATLEIARDVLRSERFDVAILDVILPDGDGLTLLSEIKCSPRMAGLPVLLLSSEDEVRDRVRGLRTGADDYVGKPYDAVQIIARARELCRSHPATDATRVVLVEDSPTFAAALREDLEEAGYAVAVAATGEDGLQVVATQPPAAVIVDQRLPGIEGADVIRRLRADAGLRRLPCLLLTASDDQAEELRALDAGADAFCQKHSGTPAILTKLALLLRSAPDVPIVQGVRSLLAPKRILAVDDSATFLGELCDQLRAEGYDVAAARSGAEAMELLESQPVDGILLDLMRPALAGPELCRRIKADPATRDIPLIILSAVDERTGMIQSVDAGADDFVTKSGDFEVLKARLRALLRRRQFENENREIRNQLHRREVQALEVQALRELSEARESLIASLEEKNAELARATAVAESLNRELESFSYSVSHDLRAPLRSISGFAQFLKEDCESSLEPGARGHLDHILAAAARMNQLIDDMLDLSRVTCSELHCVAVDLSGLAREILEGLRAQAPDRVVDVEIENELIVRGDGGLIRILLENLLGNSWKFTSKRARARIGVGRQTTADGAEAFFVRDNGAGFDMRRAEKLFGVFQRLHRQEDYPGTGVGLATAARIVRRHGGRIWAEGVPETGSTFYFSVPL